MPAKKKTEPPPPEPEVDEEVEVEFGDDAKETAILLLAAAEEAGMDQSVVRTGSGVFYVPQSIANKAQK